MAFDQVNVPGLQLEFENPSVRILTSQDQKLLYAKWLSNQMGQHWDEAVNQILLAFETETFSGYISDASIGLLISRKMMSAIVTQILPRFRKTQLRYISVILPENLSIEMTIQAILNLVPSPYRCRTSESLVESIAWIQQQQLEASKRSA